MDRLHCILAGIIPIALVGLGNWGARREKLQYRLMGCVYTPEVREIRAVLGRV